MNEWNIQSRAHLCQSCGKHFADKQHYHTVLLDERREVRRVDVCETCWKAEHADGANSRQGFISHWQGVYEAPPPAPPEAIRKESAETLLRKIIEQNDSRYSAASYILAVMLERKRILKVKEQLRRDGQRVFVYEQPKTGDIFTITDPELQLSQLEEVQRDVAALLEHGLPGDGTQITGQTAPESSPADSVASDDSSKSSEAPASPNGDATKANAGAEPVAR